MTEVPISQELLAIALSDISPESVLVGGQALAFWVSHYGVALPGPTVLVGAISDDADILGVRNDIAAIASKVRGVPSYTPQHAISALVGQVTIPVGADEFVNVDVLHRLVGVDVGKVKERASEVKLGGTLIRVMHPIDVLQSRIENLAQLKDKQNPEGVEQAKLSLLVAGAYIGELAAMDEDGQRHASKAIEYIVGIAKTGAGKCGAKEFGLRFLDALPGFVITSDRFRAIRWPQIVKEINTAAGLDPAPPKKDRGLSCG